MNSVRLDCVAVWIYCFFEKMWTVWFCAHFLYARLWLYHVEKHEVHGDFQSLLSCLLLLLFAFHFNVNHAVLYKCWKWILSVQQSFVYHWLSALFDSQHIIECPSGVRSVIRLPSRHKWPSFFLVLSEMVTKPFCELYIAWTVSSIGVRCRIYWLKVLIS